MGSGKGRRNKILNWLCGVNNLKNKVLIMLLKDTLLSLAIAVVQSLATVVNILFFHVFLSATISWLIIVLGIADLALLMFFLYVLSMPNCRLIPNKIPAILTLVCSSILAGISMAFLTTYITYFLFSYTSLLILILPLMLTLSQIFFILIYHEREVDVLSGNLIITAIGVLAMSMGMALSAIQLPHNTISFSTIAGPLIGSGLTLIAVGLQRYYEGQGAKAKCTCECACS